MEEVAVDVAGAFIGGAARFLRELDRELSTTRHDNVSVVGRNVPLTPTWLAKREWLARGASRVIALNNVSLAVAGKSRTVLLRNALHFANLAEVNAVGFRPSPSFRLQTQVVREALRFADRIVVPCSAMRERVLERVPNVQDRIHVRFHPISQAAWSQIKRPLLEQRILVPLVNSPYKQLDRHLERLLAALDAMRLEVVVVATVSPDELPENVAGHRLLKCIGVVDSLQLEEEWSNASAAYFPTALEAFGYSVAECRVNGVPVIAQDTNQNREIGGQALFGFKLQDDSSLEAAVGRALRANVVPEPDPFDRSAYFAWLLGDA